MKVVEGCDQGRVVVVEEWGLGPPPFHAHIAMQAVMETWAVNAGPPHFHS